jgi:hypothetical protein
MPIGWAIAVISLWVVVVALAIVLLGILRQVIPALERATAMLSTAAGTDSIVLGPGVGTQLPLALLSEIGAEATDHGRSVLLFMTPGCGPCKSLAEEMNRTDLSGMAAQLLIITSPDGRAELGIPIDVPIVPEREREISEPFSVSATPFAIAVDRDGIVQAARVPQTLADVVGLALVATQPSGNGSG